MLHLYRYRPEHCTDIYAMRILFLREKYVNDSLALTGLEIENISCNLSAFERLLDFKSWTKHRSQHRRAKWETPLLAQCLDLNVKMLKTVLTFFKTITNYWSALSIPFNFCRTLTESRSFLGNFSGEYWLWWSLMKLSFKCRRLVTGGGERSLCDGVSTSSVWLMCVFAGYFATVIGFEGRGGKLGRVLCFGIR